MIKLNKYWLLFDGVLMVSLGYFCSNDSFGAVGFGLIFLATSLRDEGEDRE